MYQEISAVQRKADYIVKHGTQYQADTLFRAMVDNTTYLTMSEKHESALAVDILYGYDAANGDYGA